MSIAAVVLPEERFTRPRTVGLLLGFGGALTIVGAWKGLDVRRDVLAQLACLGATTCYGLAYVYLRKFVIHRGIPAVSLAFVQVFAGAVLMLIATPVRVDFAIVARMVLLGAAGTPGVGVLLGAVLLGEPLHWNEPAGAVLVVLGILAAHGRLDLPRRDTRVPIHPRT